MKRLNLLDLGFIYLQKRNQPPMSTRRDQGETGNQIVFLLANLATHLADALARPHKICSSVIYSRKRYQQMRPAEILASITRAQEPASAAQSPQRVKPAARKAGDSGNQHAAT